MTNQQKAKVLKAHLKEVAGFIASPQWLKDNLDNYRFIDGNVYHHLQVPQEELQSPEPEPIEPDSDQIEPIDHSSELIDHSSEHLNKINEAVIIHHEGIKAFLNTYHDVQVIKAFHFQATDKFLIFCKDLKVKKKHKDEYCLFWWDWANRITTGTGDYVDCFFKYEQLINLMGNPQFQNLPEPPDLTEYYRNVTYCAADGKRCEQFTLALGV